MNDNYRIGGELYDDDIMELGCNETYSHEGRCPCCGGYVHTIGGNYADEPQQEVCEECGWKGRIEYP